MNIYTTNRQTAKKMAGTILGWIVAIVLVGALVAGAVGLGLDAVRTVWYNVP